MIVWFQYTLPLSGAREIQHWLLCGFFSQLRNLSVVFFVVVVLFSVFLQSSPSLEIVSAPHPALPRFLHPDTYTDVYENLESYNAPQNHFCCATDRGRESK